MTRRGYSERKVASNVECEIFRVCLDEALESYRREVVLVAGNNTPAELEATAGRVCGYVAGWPGSFGTLFGGDDAGQ